jgi:hypothetical protein
MMIKPVTKSIVKKVRNGFISTPGDGQPSEPIRDKKGIIIALIITKIIWRACYNPESLDFRSRIFPLSGEVSSTVTV